MGNSRVIFVGAVSMIIGLYAVGLQKAERAVNRIGQVHASQMQSEEIAKSGVSLAVNAMGTSKPSPLPSLSNQSAFGGALSFMVDDAGLAADEARITSMGIFGDHQAMRVAIVKLTPPSSTTTKKRWSSWEIVRVYSQYSVNGFNYLEE